MDIDVVEEVTQVHGTTAGAAGDSTGTLRRTLLAFALSAAPLCAMAGDVTYNSATDTTQTVAKGATSLPFTFTATSPTLPASGNPKQTPYEQYGYITADYIAKDMTYTYTDPTTKEAVTVPFDFGYWVHITPAEYDYSGPMTGPLVSASVQVPGNAEVGMYTAKLVAKGPNGIGWGEAAGVHVTVNVVDPSPTDTTPPVVTILDPALVNSAPQNFLLGNRIPVDFTAIDQESQVSAWTADLLPTGVDVSSLLGVTEVTNGIEAAGSMLSAVPGGTETIQAIGQYNLKVTASSAGGTALASRLFNVNYQINPFAPHMTDSPLTWSKSSPQQGKCGNANPGTLQVKFDARAVQPADIATTSNTATAFVRDQSVRVRIVRDSDKTPVIERTYGTDNASQVQIGGATGDSSGQYFTKVNLCDQSVGGYSVQIYFKDSTGNDFLQYNKPFSLTN